MQGLKDKGGLWRKILFFDLMPGIISLFIIISGNSIIKNDSLVNYILVTCSIFAGLLFSLIVVIVDKAKRKKDTKNPAIESEFYYLMKYLRFSRQLITKISFAIVVAFIDIVLIALLSLDFQIQHAFLDTTTTVIIGFLIFYFFIQFGILILNIISDMYDVFTEEISLKKPNQ